jgi:hypothetical protein
MPTAFALAHGLDWDTEVDSFWTWLHDARAALEGGEINAHVRELVDGQRQRIEVEASKAPDPASARFTLMTAIALVGHQYATTQKLLQALKESGLINSVGQPMALPQEDPSEAKRVP